MLAFPVMLLAPAEKAGMAIPDLSQTDEFSMEEFPHFYVFCATQLGRPMTSWTEHWENAHVIAAIPESDIKNVTPHDLIEAGFQGL